MEKTKIYFISDVHLGLYPEQKSREREKLLIKWMDEVKDQARELYLMGDIFDFWHEYKHVVPRGFTRFLGKLAEMIDAGTKIYFFSGNHDIWAYNYFEKELSIPIYHQPVIRELNGIRFFLAHGDGLGPGDFGYKILKGIFRNKILQWLFARLHPNFALWIGKTWSKSSRYSKGIVAEAFSGKEGELQIQFAMEVLKKEKFDVFIFGHRHIPWDIQLGDSSRIMNLGDWIYSFTYAELEGTNLQLKEYGGDGSNIIRDRYDLA